MATGEGDEEAWGKWLPADPPFEDDDSDGGPSRKDPDRCSERKLDQVVASSFK